MAAITWLDGYRRTGIEGRRSSLFPRGSRDEPVEERGRSDRHLYHYVVGTAQAHGLPVCRIDRLSCSAADEHGGILSLGLHSYHLLDQKCALRSRPNGFAI